MSATITPRPIRTSQAVRDRVTARQAEKPARDPGAGVSHADGTLTYDQAVTAGEFHHATATQGRGECYRVRRNGATQTWKTRPGQFRIPVKWGLTTYGQIYDFDTRCWHAADTCPRCTGEHSG